MAAAPSCGSGRPPSSSVVVALFIYFLVVSPNFFTHANMANLLSGIAAPYIILAIGEVCC